MSAESPGERQVVQSAADRVGAAPAPAAQGSLVQELMAREEELRTLNQSLERRVEGRTAALERVYRQNALILQAVGEGICGLNERGEVTFANPAALNLVGYAPLELLGQSMHRVLHYAHADGAAYPVEECPIHGALREDTVSQGADEVFWRKDGTSFPVEYVVTPMREQGKIVGAVVAFRDITERHALDRMKAELVAVVSHELRTPLASLLGFAELLLTREYPEAQRREFLTLMLEEGRRLTALLNDFLDLQRLENGRQQTAPVATPLQPLFARAVAGMGEDAQRPILVDIPTDLPRARADPERIQQVLVNLLSNARKYSPRGGEVRLTARRVGDEISVTVVDQGLGVPPEALPHLFERFYRVDSSDRRAIKGTGLGLAIVRQIIEAHGGRVWAESGGQNQGTRVTFTLPLADEQVPSTTLDLLAWQPGGVPGRPPRVLVVEDDEPFAAWLDELLRGAGYEVQVAATGEAALAAVALHPPDVLLLDLGLRGTLDGWDVLAVLRGRPVTADLPVIVVSARDESCRGRALRVSDYLVKPVSGAVLRRVLRRYHVQRGQTILVVEDDAALRRALLESLREAGFQAMGVGSGEEALATLSATPAAACGLMLLDLQLPGMDGFAVLEAVRAHPTHQALPVLVVTGCALDTAEKQRLQDRAADVLQKQSGLGLPIAQAIAHALHGATRTETHARV